MVIRPGLTVALCLLAVMMVAGGCNRGDLPELGRVRGKVSLDGKPLPGVNVVFYPQAGGRPAIGTTDSEGRYDVMYTYNAKGAKVGLNLVSLAYPQDGKGPPIPEKYGANSQLQADVKPGKNTFDFALDSKKK